MAFLIHRVPGQGYELVPYISKTSKSIFTSVLEQYDLMFTGHHCMHLIETRQQAYFKYKLLLYHLDLVNISHARYIISNSCKAEQHGAGCWVFPDLQTSLERRAEWVREGALSASAP